MTQTFVTLVGGTSGIGLALGTQLLAKGQTVLFIGREGTQMERLKKQYGDQVLFEQADLAHPAQLAALKVAISRRGKTRALIFTAGILAGNPYLTPEGNELSYMTNHYARRVLTEHLLPDLLEQPSAYVAYISPWGEYKENPVVYLNRLNKAEIKGMKASLVTMMINDVYFGQLSQRHPSLPIVAFNPGPTTGTKLLTRPTAPKVLSAIFKIFMRLIGKPAEEVARVLVEHLHQPAAGIHFYRVGKTLRPPAFLAQRVDIAWDSVPIH